MNLLKELVRDSDFRPEQPSQVDIHIGPESSKKDSLAPSTRRVKSWVAGIVLGLGGSVFALWELYKLISGK